MWRCTTLKVWKTPEKTDDDPLAGFVPMAADDWPVCVVDRWPPGRLRDTAMAAYDRLAQDGEIMPQGVQRTKQGAVIVRYLAKIPDAWVHELLGRAERGMKK